MTTHIQALLFDKNHFTEKSAEKWINDHDYRPIKPMHETENYYRYRLHTPKGLRNLRTIDFGNYIKAIIYF
jgi:hypothetical protein